MYILPTFWLHIIYASRRTNNEYHVRHGYVIINNMNMLAIVSVINGKSDMII